MTPHTPPASPAYVETIRFSSDRFHLLPYHQQRLDRTLEETGIDSPIDLSHILGSHIEGIRDLIDKTETTTVKCRVVYSDRIESVEYHPYTPRQIRSLKIVECDDIDYHLKSLDRTVLSRLHDARGEADEVIISKGGLITDTSYSNLIFCNGETFLTPETPLLKGVMRQWLLDNGLVHTYPLTEKDILPGNSLGISSVILINAMLPPHVIPPVPITDIIPS